MINKSTGVAQLLRLAGVIAVILAFAGCDTEITDTSASATPSSDGSELTLTGSASTDTGTTLSASATVNQNGSIVSSSATISQNITSAIDMSATYNSSGQLSVSTSFTSYRNTTVDLGGSYNVSSHNWSANLGVTFHF